MQTACPQCRNPGFTVHSRNQLRCGKCGHVWQATLDYPSLPGPVVLPKVNFRSSGSPGGARAKMFLVLGVVMATLVGGFYIAIASVNDEHLDGDYLPEPGKKPAARTTPADTTAKPVAEQPKVLTAQLMTSRFEGRLNKYRYWVLLLNNPHDKQIEPQKIVVRPAKTERLERSSPPVGIAAKGHMWALVMLEDESDQEYSFSVEPIAFAYAHNLPKLSRIGLKNLEVQQPAAGSYGKVQVKGELHNDTGTTLERAYVQVIGLDAERNPVSFAEYYLGENMKPGATAPFNVHTGMYEIEKPHRWEVQAFGQAKK